MGNIVSHTKANLKGSNLTFFFFSPLHRLLEEAASPHKTVAVPWKLLALLKALLILGSRGTGAQERAQQSGREPTLWSWMPELWTEFSCTKLRNLPNLCFLTYKIDDLILRDFCKNYITNSYQTVVLNGDEGNFVPQGTYVWRRVLFLLSGGICYWHLVGRSPKVLLDILQCTGQIPTARIVQNVNSAEAENS